jgi:hypothetical protein
MIPLSPDNLAIHTPFFCREITQAFFIRMVYTEFVIGPADDAVSFDYREGNHR